ncbi:MAG: hypothetical protein HXS52_00985 [Theionarchaea archaeon]|nr:hypothetical protein [Theionarchaea archaeon]
MTEKSLPSQHETLALKYSPELYYAETRDPFKDVCSDDFGGIYWRAVESSVAWADVCIQYLLYFKEQHWVPSPLDGILSKLAGKGGKLPGNHPNDYAPIFLYFKDGHPVRAVFDVCHYEAVGVLAEGSGFLPPDSKLKFQITNFYRGLRPLTESEDLTYLQESFVPRLLSQERLEDWWEGLTVSGTFQEAAKLIIREKIHNPFQEISTFRDIGSKLGKIFDLIFRSTENIPVIRVSTGDTGIVSEIQEKMPDRDDISEEDIKGVLRFAEEHVLEDPHASNYLPVGRHDKAYPM